MKSNTNLSFYAHCTNLKIMGNCVQRRLRKILRSKLISTSVDKMSIYNSVYQILTITYVDCDNEKVKLRTFMAGLDIVGDWTGHGLRRLMVKQISRYVGREKVVTIPLDGEYFSKKEFFELPTFKRDQDMRYFDNDDDLEDTEIVFDLIPVEEAEGSILDAIFAFGNDELTGKYDVIQGKLRVGAYF